MIVSGSSGTWGAGGDNKNNTTENNAAMDVNALRPAFFRFDGGRPYSGWLAPSGDFWADEETRDMIVADLRTGNGKVVAVELALEIPNAAGLILMKRARAALETGELIEFTGDVDLAPMDYVDRGERAVAVRKCKASGAVELFLHYYHKRLEGWSNCVTFEPHLSDEHLPHLRLMTASAITI